MKRLILAGVVLPLLAGAALAQTLTAVPVVRINPFVGVPLNLPHPVIVPRGLPQAVPMAVLLAPNAVPVLPATALPVQSKALPALVMNARRELPAAVRRLPTLDRTLAETKTNEKAGKARELLGNLFDGSAQEKKGNAVPAEAVRESIVIGIPERELEAELGL